MDDGTLARILADLGPLGAGDDGFAAFHAGRAAHVLAERLRQRGDYAIARGVVEQGLDAVPQLGGMRPYLLHLLADLTAYSRDFASALNLLDEAERSLDPDQKSSGVACSILALRGEVHLQLGLPDQAAPMILEALRQAEALRAAGRLDRGALLDALVKRANLRMATGAYDLLLAEVAPVLSDEELLAGRSAARARLLLRLAMAHLWFARGEDAHASLARQLFTEALSEPGLLELDRLTCQARLAQLALLSGDLEAGASHLSQARALIETTASRGEAPLPEIELAFLAALEARQARAQSPSDRSLAHARRDALAAAFAALALEWRQRPEREGGVGLLGSARAQLVIGALVEAELGADPSDAGFDRVLQALTRAESCGSLAAALGALPAGLFEVRELLPDGSTGLLIFVPAPEASHVIALDRDGCFHARLTDVRDLRAASEEFELLVRRSPESLANDEERARRGEELATRGAALAGELFPGEIAQRLARWSALSVVAADLAGNLPLEALPLASGEPLGVAKAVSHLPSLAAWVALCRRSPQSKARRAGAFDLVLVTACQPGKAALERFPELERLPIDASWIRTLTLAFPPERVQNLLGPDATRERLQDGELESAAVLHIFAHGVRDPSRERAAGLVLSPDPSCDGLFFGEDAERLRAPPLVILSACGAGRGPARAGDAGASDLSGAFLEAGADAVVLSASETDFRATALFDERLHAELARGATTAQALREARKALLSRGDLADPFHWSQMRVIGLGHRSPLAPAGGLAGSGRAIGFAPALAVAVLLCAGAFLVLRGARRA